MESVGVFDGACGQKCHDQRSPATTAIEAQAGTGALLSHHPGIDAGAHHEKARGIGVGLGRRPGVCAHWRDRRDRTPRLRDRLHRRLLDGRGGWRGVRRRQAGRVPQLDREPGLPRRAEAGGREFSPGGDSRRKGLRADPQDSWRNQHRTTAHSLYRSCHRPDQPAGNLVPGRLPAPGDARLGGDPQPVHPGDPGQPHAGRWRHSQPATDHPGGVQPL